jgi:exodeoxyribonuclease V alpha subunit
LHVLFQLAEEGHTAEEGESLLARTAELLKVESALLAVELDALWASEKVFREGPWIQSRALFQAERRIAEELTRLRRTPSVHFKNAEELLVRHEEKLKFSFTPEQRRIIVESTAHSLVVITGGPGVGKTTIVSALVSLMKASGRGVALAAPTGRAAKRLTEATGTVATTLHRLLEVDPLTGKFKRNAENKLEAAFVLIDEASMMDVFLMASLCAALPDAARLVLVGDKDQLPSVGAGAVLRDILSSEVAITFELKTVHRQSAQSGIIAGAREVLDGRVPQGARAGEELGEFYVVTCSERAKMQELVLSLALERIPKRFGLNGKKDVQILTPMHRGEVGTESLNRVLAERLTGNHESSQFLPGDRVIQLKNNYELDIYNGDMGEVLSVQEGGVLVEFEGSAEPRKVVVEGKSLKDLALSYAISIHKSQGSEFPAVIIPLSMSHYLMLHRKLLYTAITRAKKLCVLVVEPKALSLAVSEFRKDERKTRLQVRLMEALAS